MEIVIITKTYGNRNTYEIDTEKNIFKINGKDCYADIDKTCFHIDCLTSSWPSFLEDRSINDGLLAKISITSNNEAKKYVFKNKFPKNFGSLTKLLKEVNKDVSRDL